jgi:hypothetical protein
MVAAIEVDRQPTAILDILASLINKSWFAKLRETASRV